VWGCHFEAAVFTNLSRDHYEVVPVRITDFSITEEAFDPALNPIRAKVSLGLRVLSYNDLPLTHPGYYVFLAHQVIKEVMATIGSVDLQQTVTRRRLGGGGPRFAARPCR